MDEVKFCPNCGREGAEENEAGTAIVCASEHHNACGSTFTGGGSRYCPFTGKALNGEPCTWSPAAPEAPEEEA